MEEELRGSERIYTPDELNKLLKTECQKTLRKNTTRKEIHRPIYYTDAVNKRSDPGCKDRLTLQEEYKKLQK